MKKICNVCLLVLGLCSLGACNPSGESTYENLRTCTPENGSLDQEELTTFDGCQRLDGSIVLRYGFPDRANLASIIVITGNLGAGGYVGDAMSLEGLDSLEVIEGSFHFLEDNLVDYGGVPKLRSVGSFGSHGVPELVDFRGLESLTEVEGNFSVTGNPKLQSLAGLEGLERVHGDVRISDNPLLPEEEVEAFLARVTVDGEVKGL